MSPENQAENTSPSTEKTAKATPPKPSKPKSSVIQIHPEGERIHPKKAEGRFAKLRIAAVLATQFVFIRYSMVQLERPSGGFIQYP